MANFLHCGTSKFFANGCCFCSFGNLPEVDVEEGVVSKYSDEYGDGGGISIAHWVSAHGG
jgi:hypothetical protein